jgi:hypothetical protein
VTPTAPDTSYRLGVPSGGGASTAELTVAIVGHLKPT